MTYVKDKDGEFRQPITVQVRLTRDELYEYNRRAQQHGYYDICAWLVERVLSDLGYIEEKLPLD